MFVFLTILTRLTGFAKATKTAGAILEAISKRSKPSCVGVDFERFKKNLQTYLQAKSSLDPLLRMRGAG